MTQAFRRQYYELVKRTLREQHQVIPCLAGIASAQIAPNGDVWTEPGPALELEARRCSSPYGDGL